MNIRNNDEVNKVFLIFVFIEMLRCRNIAIL